MGNPNPSPTTRLQPGQNPRTVLPRHKERGPSFKGQLKRIAELRGGEIQDGDEKVMLNLEAHTWYKLLRDARDDKKFDLQARVRALTAFSDRLHGKPIQRDIVKHSGTVTVEGKLLSDMGSVELNQATAFIESGTHTVLDGRLVPIQDAEFTDEPSVGDLSNSIESGDSEA